MTVESTISRANDEIAKGRLWRAKEILGSSISTYRYSKKIFHALATVLLKMGDDFEAGKFLLLSIDSPSPTEMSAINLFLARYDGQEYRSLLAKFPAAARVENRDDYPEFLRNYLSELGAPQTLAMRELLSPAIANRKTDRIFLIGCGLFAFIAIICIVVGATTILSWFWNAR